jgi:hypothetical protein
MFDFPGAPVVGDKYTSGSASYTWDGISWNIETSPTAADYVLKAGDTMTGSLSIQDPHDLNVHGRLVLHKPDATVIRMNSCEIRQRLEGGGEGFIELWTDNGGWSTVRCMTTLMGSSGGGIHADAAGVTTNGDFQTTTAAQGKGHYIGDKWHGMTFNGSDTLELVEYHGIIKFYKRTTGTSGGELLATINTSGVTSNSINFTDPAIVAAVRADPVLQPFVRRDDDEAGDAVNLGALLMYALAEIKQLKTEIAQLRGAR